MWLGRPEGDRRNMEEQWSPDTTEFYEFGSHHPTSPYVTLRHPTSPYVTLRHPTSPYVTLRHPTSPYVTLRP